MFKINYSIDVKVSQFEWFVIREIRKLQSVGHGKIELIYQDGNCVDFKPTIRPYSTEQLLEMQK